MLHAPGSARRHNGAAPIVRRRPDVHEDLVVGVFAPQFCGADIQYASLTAHVVMAPAADPSSTMDVRCVRLGVAAFLDQLFERYLVQLLSVDAEPPDAVRQRLKVVPLRLVREGARHRDDDGSSGDWQLVAPSQLQCGQHQHQDGTHWLREDALLPLRNPDSAVVVVPEARPHVSMRVHGFFLVRAAAEHVPHPMHTNGMSSAANALQQRQPDRSRAMQQALLSRRRRQAAAEVVPRWAANAAGDAHGDGVDDVAYQWAQQPVAAPIAPGLQQRDATSSYPPEHNAANPLEWNSALQPASSASPMRWRGRDDEPLTTLPPSSPSSSSRYHTLLASLEERVGAAERQGQDAIEQLVRVAAQRQSSGRRVSATERLAKPRDRVQGAQEVGRVPFSETLRATTPETSPRQSSRVNIVTTPTPRHRAPTTIDIPLSPLVQQERGRRRASYPAASLSSSMHHPDEAAASGAMVAPSRVGAGGVTPTQNRALSGYEGVCDRFVPEPALPNFCFRCGTSLLKHRAKRLH